MQIPCNYEVNVAKYGEHYCKIELSERLRDQAVRKFKELEQIYKAQDDNFDLTLMYIECHAKRINLE